MTSSSAFATCFTLHPIFISIYFNVFNSRPLRQPPSIIRDLGDSCYSQSPWKIFTLRKPPIIHRTNVPKVCTHQSRPIACEILAALPKGWPSEEARCFAIEKWHIRKIESRLPCVCTSLAIALTKRCIDGARTCTKRYEEWACYIETVRKGALAENINGSTL